MWEPGFLQYHYSGLTHSPLGSWGLTTNVIKCPLTTQVSHKLPGNHISLKSLYIKEYHSLIRFTNRNDVIKPPIPKKCY